jgi:protein required for attachment to host cells
MLDLKFAHGDVILVCDGARALILENIGDAKFPNFRTREAVEEPHASTREQGADAPGRVHASVGSARSAVEQTDWKNQSEADFLERVLKKLEADSANIRKLHIVAPPKALGILRHSYSNGLKAILGEEIAKDLTGMPVHEIEKLLTGGAPGAA